MEKMVGFKEFFNKKKILITGHTGFKGSWLSKILVSFGAEVFGYSLKPSMSPNIYDILQLENSLKSNYSDIRDYSQLKKVFDNFEPEIVFHLAAQPLVIESYKNPLYTYEVNIMGTVNILECIRNSTSVKSFINVTTDKVYRNEEWFWGYRESESLNGFDPYSNSKSCSDLATQSYIRSFLSKSKISSSIVRSGNVIGGGDFSENRIIPDCARFASLRKTIEIRNPHSTRPYQHVLEPLFAYLHIAKKQFESIEFSDTYNIGPDDESNITNSKLASLFCYYWGDNLDWRNENPLEFHEANFLKLDISKIRSRIDWKPLLTIENAVKMTTNWYKLYYSKNSDDIVEKLTIEQINEYYNLFSKEILR